MSIPSRTWFPQSLQDRAAWFDNFNTNMQTIGLTLGFVAADLASLAKDRDMIEFLAGAAVTLETYVDAIRQYRLSVTEGNIGDPTPTWPADLALAGSIPVAPGIFERLDKMVKRIRTAPAYTDEVGALLGIIPTKSDSVVETEMKPTLKASSMPGSVVEVTFTRGKSDGITIETKIDNSATWSSAGTYFKSPVSLNIPDGTGLPHSVQLRARYIIGNEPVGLNSDTVNVVTTP